MSATTLHSSSVVIDDLTFAWPDGSPVLRHLRAAFSAGRTGLIGANGSGKSTLLRLIAHELTPSSGSITTSGSVGYLPQQLTLRTGTTLAELLGVRRQLDALRAIEAGDVAQRHFDELGDGWDVEARARAELGRIGLAGVDLDRVVGTLSGGETVLAALAGLRLADTAIVLLDEPTNNLDRQARHRLYDAISSWRGTLVVVSHDVTLLELMDETAELRSSGLSIYGGGYSAYREQVALEQQAAEQALRTAEQGLRTEQRQRVAAETALARRRRYARTDFENKRRPKIIMNQRKGEAQVSAGRLRGQLDAKVDQARRAVDERAELVRRDQRIRVDLPDPGVPAARHLAELHDGRGVIVVRGPERVAITGRNGIGKTRLVETLADPARAVGRTVHAVPRTDRVGYLPQVTDHLADHVSVLDTVRAAAPGVPPGDIRAALARFLLGADAVSRPVGSLSGGERFRVALARLLLASPPHQLLVLDEPTNDLDLDTRAQLVDALNDYHGGLVVVSHDDEFLAQLGIDTWVRLDDAGLTLSEPVRDR